MLKIQKQAAPLRQQVLDSLREAIITGQLAPRKRLIERELIEMTGVSRTVIREALRQLETEGLIEIIPNTGPVVRELTAAEAKDLYRIRAVLEGLAARLFVENASPEQVENLSNALELLIDAYNQGNAEHVLDTKNKFYNTLYEGANSESLGTMLGMLYARIWRWRALGLTHPQRSAERSRESIKGLRSMMAAITERSAENAERIAIEEAHKAAEEVARLLEIDPAA